MLGGEFKETPIIVKNISTTMGLRLLAPSPKPPSSSMSIKSSSPTTTSSTTFQAPNSNLNINKIKKENNETENNNICKNLTTTSLSSSTEKKGTYVTSSMIKTAPRRIQPLLPNINILNNLLPKTSSKESSKTKPPSSIHFKRDQNFENAPWKTTVTTLLNNNNDGDNSGLLTRDDNHTTPTTQNSPSILINTVNITPKVVNSQSIIPIQWHHQFTSLPYSTTIPAITGSSANSTINTTSSTVNLGQYQTPHPLHHLSYYGNHFYNDCNQQGRKRRKTSQYEQEQLETWFQLNQKPNAYQRQLMAHKLNLPGRTIQIWFQNKRQSLKRRETSAASTTSGNSNISSPSIESFSGRSLTETVEEPFDESYNPSYQGTPATSSILSSAYITDNSNHASGHLDCISFNECGTSATSILRNTTAISFSSSTNSTTGTDTPTQVKVSDSISSLEENKDHDELVMQAALTLVKMSSQPEPNIPLNNYNTTAASTFHAEEYDDGEETEIDICN